MRDIQQKRIALASLNIVFEFSDPEIGGRLDGKRSPEEMIDEVQANYTLPWVNLMVDIFQVIRLLSEKELVRLK